MDPIFENRFLDSMVGSIVLDAENDKLVLANFWAHKNPPCYVSVVDYINNAIDIYSYWMYAASYFIVSFTIRFYLMIENGNCHFYHFCLQGYL